MVGFKFFKDRFSHSRTHKQQVLSLSQSPQVKIAIILTATVVSTHMEK